MPGSNVSTMTEWAEWHRRTVVGNEDLRDHGDERINEKTGAGDTHTFVITV